jgi:RimJ/RimL family protein N-acetyltransferase
MTDGPAATPWAFLAAGVTVDGVRARSWAVSDIPASAPAFRDAAIGGEAGLPPFDEEELRSFTEERLPSMVADGSLVPFVIEDGTGILGGGSLQGYNPFRDTIEIGYWLFPAARGRGVGSRIVGAVAERLFAGGIARVVALIRPENTASIRLAERAGFVNEGRLRSALNHGERRADALVYGLLPEDLPVRVA